MATSAQIETLERRLVITIWVVMFLVILAAFAGVLRPTFSASTTRRGNSGIFWF